jgi:hypothetical protein
METAQERQGALCRPNGATVPLYVDPTNRLAWLADAKRAKTEHQAAEDAEPMAGKLAVHFTWQKPVFASDHHCCEQIPTL